MSRSLIENDECTNLAPESGVFGMLPLDLMDLIITELFRIDAFEGGVQKSTTVGTLAVQAFTSTCRGTLGRLSREHAVELKSRCELQLALTPDLINQTYPYTTLMLRTIRSYLEQCILDDFLCHHQMMNIPYESHAADYLTRMAMGNRNVMCVKCVTSGSCRLLCGTEHGAVISKNDRDVLCVQNIPTNQLTPDLKDVCTGGYEYSATMHDEGVLVICARDASEHILDTPSTYTVTSRNVIGGEVVAVERITVGDMSHCGRLLVTWVHRAELWMAFCVSGMGYASTQTEVQLIRIRPGRGEIGRVTRLPIFDDLKCLSIASQKNHMAIMEGLRGNKSVLLHFFDANTLQLTHIDGFEMYPHKVGTVELSPNGSVMVVIACKSIYIYHRCGSKTDPMGWRRVTKKCLHADLVNCTLTTSVFSPCGSRVLFFFHGGGILGIDVALSLKTAFVHSSHRYCTKPCLETIGAIWSNGLYLLTQDQSVLWLGFPV